ncbi:MAG TPA: hypothetical protein VLS28_09450 [Candidatus Sulfomarinibacteraceae bacterium]|nr:hypothetical protein [Candidatus Sulfomarinibacteraceae bacterium]
MRRIGLTLAAATAMLLGAVAPVAAHDPTCADFGPLGIVVHGQHVVRDYVTGGELSGWPAAGGVGQYIAGEGAALPGGPGPGFHFPNDFAPGASFCTDSNSPGRHF